MNELLLEHVLVNGERVTFVFPKSKSDLIRNKISKIQNGDPIKIQTLENFILLNGGWIKDF